MENRSLTEVGHVAGQSLVARRAADLFGERVMYVPRAGWFVYDGRCWSNGQDAAERHVRRFVEQAARDLIRESATMEEAVGKKVAAVGFATLGSAPQVTGAMQFLSEDLRVLRVMSDLDPDPWLLNCSNGTFDLRTKELRPHDPADRITRVTKAAWDPEAKGPTWEYLMTTALPDDKMRNAFLRCMGGCGLPGVVQEHIFPLMYGRSGTGKSSVIHAIEYALGDYAVTLDPEVLIARNHNPHPTIYMDLRGARFGFISETDEGAQLAVARMKRLTGGDTINAHRMYSNPVEFEPSHLFVMATNHLPHIPDVSDDAVWRRLRVVPFQVPVTGAEGFWDMLEAEADAVLASLWWGYQSYIYEKGVGWPASVESATRSYQDESDVLLDFITEFYETGSTGWSKVSSVYQDWVEWVRQRHDPSLTPGRNQDFVEQLRRHGFTVEKNKGERALIIHGLQRKTFGL